jgi:hypothetical protein
MACMLRCWIHKWVPSSSISWMHNNIEYLTLQLVVGEHSWDDVHVGACGTCMRGGHPGEGGPCELPCATSKLTSKASNPTEGRQSYRPLPDTFSRSLWQEELYCLSISVFSATINDLPLIHVYSPSAQYQVTTPPYSLACRLACLEEIRLATSSMQSLALPKLA